MSQWKHCSINKLVMTNFKRFYGRHELELTTRPDLGKPLILIGGDNGRGKTSIHEAINYVFYEDGDLPGIQTKPSYLRAVTDRLNRRALDEGQTDYGVALDITVSDGSVERNLHIERKWDVDVARRRVNEPILAIYENGRTIDWLEDTPIAYQDFLRHILPPKIAPFFLFDAERIQEFADEDGHDRRMVEAIEDILHITVYKLLRDDLKKMVIDPIEKNEIKISINDDFYELKKEEDRIIAELEEKQDRLRDAERELAEANRARKLIEDELRRVASPNTSRRDELIVERQRIEAEIESAKADMQRGFESIPILLTGKLWKELLETLATDQVAVIGPDQLQFISDAITTIEQRVFEPNSLPKPEFALSPDQKSFYVNLHRAVSEEVLGLSDLSNVIQIHDLSRAEREIIINRLQRLSNSADLLRDAVNRRERATSELREVEKKLLDTSHEPYIEETIARSQKLSETIGKLENEIHSINGEIQRLQANLATRRRQIADREEQRKASTEAMKVIRLARKAQTVLDDFIHLLAPEKLEVLKSNFEHMYGLLKKPEDPVFS